MKNLMRLGFVVLATGALATVSFACDKDKTADATAQKGAGCPHAAAAAAKAEHPEGCAHAAAAEAALAKYEDQNGGCPFHSKASEAQRAALLKGEKVTLVGQVVCAHCDLKQGTGCKSVFRTENGQIYSIVANDAFEKLASATMHGEKRVEIVGTAAKDASETIVLLTSYKLVG